MKVRGDMDASDEADREGLKRLAVLGTELAGEPEWGAAATLGWRSFMFAVKEYGGAMFVDQGPERTEEVKDKDDDVIAQSNYTMTSTLLEGGWKTSTPPPDDLKGPDGSLKSYEELVKDNQIDTFNEWVNDQRTGTVPLQEKQALASGLLNNSQVHGVAHDVDGQ